MASPKPKDLIIDNAYIVNQSDDVDLKCPIELNKQPSKEASSGNSEAAAKLVSLEYYDDYEGEKLNNNDVEELKSEAINKRSDPGDSSDLFMVQWFKDSLRINKQMRYKQDGVYLRIRNVNLKDAGKYKCKLINGFGSVTTTLTLNVLASTTKETTILTTEASATTTKSADLVRLPVFTNPERMQPRRLKKKSGSQVRFKCRASGVPRPDIVWFKNGEILNEEEFGITR